MNKLLYFALSLFLIIGVGSCTLDNDGYPSNVYFPKEGGCKIIYGNGGFYGLTIWEGDNEIVGSDGIDSTYLESDSYDFEIASSEWMTATHWRNSDSIVIRVKPNLTGKRRNSRINGMEKNSPVDIYVRQDK